MTADQFARFRDFAVRLASTYPVRRNATAVPGRKWIVENVAEFIDGIPEYDRECVVSWDHSTNYPPGHQYYRRTVRTSCWNCIQAITKNRKTPCPYRCEEGSICDYAHPFCLGDTFREWELESFFPYWRRYASAAEIKRAKADDDSHDDIQEAVCDRWGAPVSACVRASLDVASAPSAGVLGFTAGCIRRAYPEGVPGWLVAFIDGDDATEWVEPGKVVPGVGFTMKPAKRRPPKFAKMKDARTLWL